jgi:DNA repair protein RadC
LNGRSLERSVIDLTDREGELPRERLARVGVRGLADRELLALVLGHGMPGRSARDIASALLQELGGIHELARVSSSRLARTAGVGEAQASRLIAAVELGRRTVYVLPKARQPLHSPEDLAHFLVPMFGAYPVERIGVVMLDGRHRFLQVRIISEGTVDAAVALPRDVYREAAISGAAAVVLFHNHPSGDPMPSEDDLKLTQRMAEAGRILGINLIDHIILADGRYSSLRRARLL